MDHKYKLKYRLDPEAGKFTKEELAKCGDDTGGTDALLVASILYPEDGSLSVLLSGFDGRSGEVEPLDDNEIFKVWSLMANKLSQSSVLNETKRQLVSEAFNLIKELVLEGRAETPLHIVEDPEDDIKH